MSQILSHTRAAQLIVEHADTAGLPMPFSVSATEYDVRLQVDNLDDLTDWSTYMDTPIADHEYKGDTHHVVTGPFLEQVIEVRAITQAVA